MQTHHLHRHALVMARKLGRLVSQTTSPKPGTAPGIEYHEGIHQRPESGAVKIRYTFFEDEKLETVEFLDTDAFLAFNPPESAKWHWIDVVGLHPHSIHAITQKYGIHSLAAEDIFNIPQRAKVETYDDALFIVQRMLILQEHDISEEQVSFWHKGNTLLTFQERQGDAWAPVRQRMNVPRGRMRQLGTPYLLYALIDAIVDQLFPILETFETPLNELEEAILAHPKQDTQRQIYAIRRELASLKRVLWPIRESVDQLYRNEDLSLPDTVQNYFRDVYDHILQANEMLESYRDMTSSLNDLYNNAVSAKMNEIMKVLTIMASVFIPITFLAGVYGMNFEHIPELGWEYAYPTFWTICIVAVLGLTVFFKTRKWL